ncbi:MAG: hypothetical protein ABI346_10730 [Candidatus Baltobacteraceae bacterium]
MLAPGGASAFGIRGADAGRTLHRLYNLNYANGSITVFNVANGSATVFSHFTPSPTGAQGLAVDRLGRIYTTLTAAGSSPCSVACIEVFAPNGTLLAQIPAPILPSAPGTPSLTDISVDAHGNVYVSDYGQQAVYFFTPSGSTWTGPTVVVQNSTNAASVLSVPNGGTVFVSGGCGFAAVRPYVRTQSGDYQPGACFGIGTIALIGGATENDGDVLTPVDGARGLVSVSAPNGRGANFSIPDPRGEVGGVALADGGAIAYVADHHGERIYAFARPANGWLSATKPRVLAVYKGFRGLNIIAVRE